MGEKDIIAASRFVRQLASKIGWIAVSGFPGVSRDDLRPGLKALPFRKRCIYFRTTPDEVIILRVLHGHQDLSADLFDEEQQED
ncbi:type II toxin-antitoxin system RelE/ParE family toxin [Affinirhizobium pseudoryzae]|uniref:type II toxin-antitoxin system RelE/ParE family toxin n=1 Tax=Allorhizobium pseudoryzae TaxID=379684 RepID=UPI001F1BAA3A|nr:type II toxin-antitoxin system RelE/ParE family toxin [Allorhizobium pseudoryzae]